MHVDLNFHFHLRLKYMVLRYGNMFGFHILVYAALYLSHEATN